MIFDLNFVSNITVFHSDAFVAETATLVYIRVFVWVCVQRQHWTSNDKRKRSKWIRVVKCWQSPVHAIGSPLFCIYAALLEVFLMNLYTLRSVTRNHAWCSFGFALFSIPFEARAIFLLILTFDPKHKIYGKKNFSQVI